MTLQEAKDHIARKHSYDLPEPKHEFDLKYYQMLDEAAELYAERLKEELKDANDALRSTYEVCKREGKDTRWREFTVRIMKSLESQHKILYPEGKDKVQNEWVKEHGQQTQ